jgi:meiotically up-regulated gene 157 (Mug157) protein
MPTHNSYADGVIVNPPVNNRTVFECKYEIDSLCGFIKLSRSYYQATNDSSIMNENCVSSYFLHNNGLTSCHLGKTAIDQIFRVITEQSQSTFDDHFNVISFYNWTGGPGSLSPAVDNEGNGEPKAFTGISWLIHSSSVTG